MASESISAAVTPAATAAQLRSMSPSGARERNSTTSPAQKSCSRRCTSEGFQIRPQAVK